MMNPPQMEQFRTRMGISLGIDRFGQAGDLYDLYRTYRLDAEAIIDAAAELFLED